MSRKEKFEVGNDFRSWLINEAGLSSKVSYDVISRLRRISEEIESDLDIAISSEVEFVKLLRKIRAYSNKHSSNVRSAYSLSATLKSSLRKYALFKQPEKSKNYLHLYLK